MQTILEQGVNYYRVDTRHLPTQPQKVKLEKDNCSTVYANVSTYVECCDTASISFNIQSCLPQIGLWCLSLLDQDNNPIFSQFVNVSKNVY